MLQVSIGPVYFRGFSLLQFVYLSYLNGTHLGKISESFCTLSPCLLFSLCRVADLGSGLLSEQKAPFPWLAQRVTVTVRLWLVSLWSGKVDPGLTFPCWLSALSSSSFPLNRAFQDEIRQPSAPPTDPSPSVTL